MNIRVDHYTDTDETIVFIDGHALVERDISIAYKLAKGIGQTVLTVTTYSNDSSPVKEEYIV